MEVIRMVKKKISKKQELCLDDLPKRRLKSKSRVLKVSSLSRLADKNLIFESLWECLIDQDLDSFKEILKSHIDAVGMSELSKKTKASKRTMYRTLSEEGNPTLKSISRIVSALWG